ncbi:MAG: Peptide chain release factor N(5)-glutamine methyltransferase [Nitrospira sp.]|jgi:release factor glutamine methyltransferase|nr:MAG: Peptide chain release factor N(5)-glutamine methyltransferase [Nitrospira sp.]
MNVLRQGLTGAPVQAVGALLAGAEEALKGAGIEQSALEAAWLLEQVLALSPLMLRVKPDRRVTGAEWAAVQALVARRVGREPLQYLLGTQEFCGREFRVTPSVLIPRPESALLVEETIRRCQENRTATVVDVGTGSGCLAVSVAAALPDARILAIDVSSEALVVARANMAQHGVENRIECFCGDLLAPLGEYMSENQADVVLSNPPYIAEIDWMTLQPEVRCFEPRMALAGGHDGMDLHRRLIQQAPAYLKPGGVLLMEVGLGQASSVCRLAEEGGWFRTDDVLRDDSEIDRVVCLERKGDGPNRH